MPVFRSPRWAYGALAWLTFFVASHVVLVLFPGDDPTGDGPWGMTAYVVFNVVLISMSAVGAAVVVATLRPEARALPRWLLLTPLWFGSMLLILRGVPGMAENLLMLTGVRRGGLMGDQDISTSEFWAGIGINTCFFVGAVLLVATTVSYARRSREGRPVGPIGRRPRQRRTDTAFLPPPRWARIAGHLGWIAPIVGFVPLHLPWIFGIPWMAHEKSFEAWYHGLGHGSGSYPEDGILGVPAGAMYLGVLLLLAVLGGILSLGLIQRWGLVYPSWVPFLRGRRVAPWFPLTPAVLGSLLLVGYSLTLPVQIPQAVANASEQDPFTLTGALIGLPILLIWAVALPVATCSYWRRTRLPRPPAGVPLWTSPDGRPGPDATAAPAGR